MPNLFEHVEAIKKVLRCSAGFCSKATPKAHFVARQRNESRPGNLGKEGLKFLSKATPLAASELWRGSNPVSFGFRVNGEIRIRITSSTGFCSKATPKAHFVATQRNESMPGGIPGKECWYLSL